MARNIFGDIVHAADADGTPSPGLLLAMENFWRNRVGSTSNSSNSSTQLPPSTTTTTTATSTAITPSSIDSAEASNINTGGTATRSALDTVINGRGFLTANTSANGTLDSAVSTLINGASTLTRAALASLMSSNTSSSGTTTTTTSQAAKAASTGPRIYVEDYRAANGSDDATVRAAIQAAAKASATFEHPIVEFAARSYSVTNGVFSDIGVVVQAGMTFVGQGYTTLKLITNGAEAWFYDNGSSDGSQGNDAKDHRRLAFAKWEGFNFTTDDATRVNGNGFRFTGIGLAFEQNYMFDHCRFNALNVCFKTAGTLNTDSIRLYDCYGYDVNTALVLSNNQSVLMEWFGTAFELVRKDVFRVESGGGGDVKIYGGSWVMEKASGDSGTYAFLRVASTDSTAWGNGNFFFHGIKPELRDADTMLASLPGPSGAVYTHFIDCNLHTASSTAHDMVLLGSNRRVTFTGCVLPEAGRYVIDVGYEAQSAPLPSLRFENCDTPEDLASMVSWKNARFGAVTARNSRAIQPTKDFGSGYVNDFDLNTLTGTFRGVIAEKKVLPLMPTGMYAWPCANTGTREWSAILPPGAIITRIVLNRPALNSSTTAYQLAVSNGDKSTIYASTPASGTYGPAVTLDASVSVQIPTDATQINARTVRLYAPKAGDSSPAAFGVGYAFIEYI